jgi:hypothetical protein
VLDTATVDQDYLLTGGYYGLTVGPAGDFWVGGIYRSFHCDPGDAGFNFWGCESDDQKPQLQIDIWPDPLSHDARPSQRVDDYISGLAMMADGSVWASARNRQDNPSQPQAMGVGIAHLNANGQVMAYLTEAMLSTHLTALHADPLDDSLWIGSEAGLMRYQPASGIVYQFGTDVLGHLAGGYVSNIQIDTSGPTRRMIVAFLSGAVAIYSGR